MATPGVSAESRLRLFVAIELPEAWTAALGALQQRMTTAFQSDAHTAGLQPRWVRAEGIHLTLKFIGEVEASRLPAMQSQLAQALSQPRELSLTLRDTGSFSDGRAPRVLWAGVEEEPAGALAELAGAIDTALAAADVPQERRPFRPHLTLARLPDRMAEADRRRCAAAVAGIEAPALPPWQVEGVSLMQSFLGAGGARYRCLERWRL